VTDDEARMKWCPFAKVASELGGSFNRYTRGEAVGGPANCIASDCMAWRTRHQWLDNAQEEPDWVSYAPYAFAPGDGQERDNGYCGRIGEP
jgi:hypothetical protein